MRHESPNPIHAPYNFVPLSDWVYEQPKGVLISQDLPSPEGLSGVLKIELTTNSPLLVGGEQIKEPNGQTKVPFFRLPNAKLAIPGSSIRGMIRNVLEIATFGKMRMVDDKRYGLRDISGKYVKEVYRSSLFGSDPNNPHPLQSGFLRRGADGSPEITPCLFTKVSHIDMEERLAIKGGLIFRRGDTVLKKYQKWEKCARTAGWPYPATGGQAKYDPAKGELPTIHFSMGEMRTVNPEKPQSGATNLGKGSLQGTLVFTGQVSERIPGRKGGKYKDFIFFSPNEKAVLVCDKVPKMVWQAFRSIHGDDGKPLKRFENTEEQPNSLKGVYPWMDFWKDRFFKGLDVPVFFRLDPLGRVMTMGLAYMFKRSCDYSIGDVIDRTSDLHRRADVLDFPERLFGRVGEEGEAHDSLKGRVSFGVLCPKDNTPKPSWGSPTILNGPKPTYFPNYMVQKDALNGKLQGRGVQYSTFMDEESKIRGWKRYPARPENAVKQQILGEKQSSKVQVVLETLPKGVKFTGKVRFHNLLPAELGAILWALEWGGRANLSHSLGMGRSFGFGQVSLQIVSDIKENVIPNYKNESVKDKSAYITDFTNLMDDAYKKNHLGQPWEQSEQLLNLLAMADKDKVGDRVLRHMVMGMGGKNDFVAAKQAGLVLPPYVETSVLPVSSRVAGQNLGRKNAGSDLESTCSWVDEVIQKLMKTSNTEQDLVLRGKTLAEEWQAIDDPQLKQQALREIDRRWQKHDLWNQLGKSLKKAKAIYQEGLPGL